MGLITAIGALASASTTIATGVDYNVDSAARRNALQTVQGINFTFASGFPSGQFGLFTNVAGVKFHNMNAYRDFASADMAGRWSNYLTTGVDNNAIGSTGTALDRLELKPANNFTCKNKAVLLRGLRVGGPAATDNTARFCCTFSIHFDDASAGVKFTNTA